uniref:Uncharacterized protein n=1 Tax=Panagrolaimus sp. PS1159 TaxID=55785 RepID=A0AC35G791_9BILA
MNNILIVSVSAKKINDTQSSLIKSNQSSTTPPTTSSSAKATTLQTTTISSTKAPITSTATEAATVEAKTESQSNHSAQHSQTPTPNIYIKTLGGEETCFYDGMPWCSSSASHGTFYPYSTLDARIFTLFIAQFIV